MYGTRFPDGLPDRIADALGSPDGAVRLGRFLDVVHSAGFTQSEVDAALAWYGNELATAEGAVKSHQHRAAETALADLRPGRRTGWHFKSQISWKRRNFGSGKLAFWKSTWNLGSFASSSIYAMVSPFRSCWGTVADFALTRDVGARFC